MSRSRIPVQATEAIDLYDKVAMDYPDSRVTLTGHLLGGSLAQIVGAVRGVETVTFNAYGTKDMFQNTIGLKTSNITNYVNAYDPISMASAENHLGDTYIVPSQSTKEIRFCDRNWRTCNLEQ